MSLQVKVTLCLSLLVSLHIHTYFSLVENLEEFVKNKLISVHLGALYPESTQGGLWLTHTACDEKQKDPGKGNSLIFKVSHIPQHRCHQKYKGGILIICLPNSFLLFPTWLSIG